MEMFTKEDMDIEFDIKLLTTGYLEGTVCLRLFMSNGVVTVARYVVLFSNAVCYIVLNAYVPLERLALLEWRIIDGNNWTLICRKF